ncbi:DNA ligase [Streptomyces fumanus]
MLAAPGSLPPPAQDARWAYETKQDGQRVVAYLPGDGSVRLRARSGRDITGAYPELHALGAAVGATPAVLDGEVLALDAEGRADFQLLPVPDGPRPLPAGPRTGRRPSRCTSCCSTRCTSAATPCCAGPTPTGGGRWRASG